ncbi:MAG: indolepyruvate oxidoreductase subunit beta [Chloroflexota bacterium]
MKALAKEPFNLIITGVGGQGVASIAQLVGRALLREGYLVNVGDIYGITQRGGSIVSHVRVSGETSCGPLIPQGKGDAVLGLEPMETLRALVQFGNPGVTTIANLRPVYPIGVISGEEKYPDLERVAQAIKRLSARCWLVDASQEAARLGNPILVNMLLMGALIGSGLLPLGRESVEPILREEFPEDKFNTNLKAFNLGMEFLK